MDNNKRFINGKQRVMEEAVPRRPLTSEELSPGELEQAYQQAAFGSPPSETVMIATLGAIRQALQEAVEVEREACAQVAEQHASANEGFSEEEYAAHLIAAAIRARGAK